jgi:exodeoxyribonuclease V alpha subunit
VADVTRLSWPVAHGTQVRQMLQAAWQPWWLGVQALLASGKGASDEEARDLLQAFSRFSVLCSLREGPWGVENMNQVIAHALGLPETLWCLGRPVMVTRNNAGLGLMNGDVGLCLPRASTASGEPPSLRVAFPDGAQGVRWVAPSRLDAVVFAMTVHKSQGSEFDHVLLVLPDRMAPVMTRELVYTGLTRARSRLTLWAPQVQVLWQACARQVLRSGGLAD